MVVHNILGANIIHIFLSAFSIIFSFYLPNSALGVLSYKREPTSYDLYSCCNIAYMYVCNIHEIHTYRIFSVFLATIYTYLLMFLQLDIVDLLISILVFHILLLVSFTDIVFSKVPNYVTYPAYITVSLYIYLEFGAPYFLFQLLSSFIIMSILFIIKYIRDIIGGGDIKLIGLFCMLIGPMETLKCVWISSIIALIYVLVSGGVKKSKKIVFAPFLSLGFILVDLHVRGLF